MDRRVWMLMLPLVIVAVCVLSLGYLFVPFFCAVLLHYATRPCVLYFKRYMPLGWAYALMSVFLAACLLTVLLVLLPLLLGQLQLLISAFPSALKQWFMDAQMLFAKHDAHRWVSEAQLQAWVEQGLGSINRFASESVAFLASSIRSVVASVLAMAMVPVFYYVLGCYQAYITSGMLALIPRAWRSVAYACLEDLDACLMRYVFGQVAVIMLLICLYTLGFLYLSVPAAVLLGCLSGMMVMIPVFGPMVSCMISVLVVWTQMPNHGPVAYVLMLYAVVASFEGMCLSPWLLGKAMGLPNSVVLILMAVAQECFGLWGVLLTPAATTIARVVFSHAYTLYVASDFYQSARRPGASASTD